MWLTASALQDAFTPLPVTGRKRKSNGWPGEHTPTSNIPKSTEAAAEHVQVTCNAPDPAQPRSSAASANASGVVTMTHSTRAARRRSNTGPPDAEVADPSGNPIAAGDTAPEPNAKRQRVAGRAQQKRSTRGAAGHVGSLETSEPDSNVASAPQVDPAIRGPAVAPVTNGPAPAPQEQTQVGGASEQDAACPTSAGPSNGAGCGKGADAVEGHTGSAGPAVENSKRQAKRKSVPGRSTDASAGPSGTSYSEGDHQNPSAAAHGSRSSPRQGSGPFQSPVQGEQDARVPRSALKRSKLVSDGSQGLVSQSRDGEGQGPLDTRRVSFSATATQYSVEPPAPKWESAVEANDANSDATLQRVATVCPTLTPVCSASLTLGWTNTPEVGHHQTATLPPVVPSAARTTRGMALLQDNGVPLESRTREVAPFNSGEQQASVGLRAMPADGTAAVPTGPESAKGICDAVPSARTTSLATDSEDFHSSREAMTPASNPRFVTPGTDLLQSQQGQPRGNPSTGREYSTRRTPAYISTLSAEQAAQAVKLGLLHKTPEQADGATDGSDRIQNVTIPPPPAFPTSKKSRSSKRDPRKAEASKGDAKENAADVNVLGKSGEVAAVVEAPPGLERCAGEGHGPLQELPHRVQSPGPTKASKGRARTYKAHGGDMEHATTVHAENSSGPGDAAQGGVDGVGVAAGVCTPMPQPRTGTDQVDLSLDKHVFHAMSIAMREG
jgi:hypothetical protein